MAMPPGIDRLYLQRQAEPGPIRLDLAQQARTRNRSTATDLGTSLPPPPSLKLRPTEQLSAPLAVKMLCALRPAGAVIGGWARSLRHVLAVLPAFLLACLAVAALPGPSTALFLHRTVRDGRAAGLAAVAGNEIGVFCWALAAGAGLTGLLRANRWLYLALHVVGAVVLVYLGVSAWRSARRQGDDAEFGAAFARRLPSGRTPAAAFRASLVTIAANPRAVFAFSGGGGHAGELSEADGPGLRVLVLPAVPAPARPGLRHDRGAGLGAACPRHHLLRRHRAARVPGPGGADWLPDWASRLGPAGTRPGRTQRLESWPLCVLPLPGAGRAQRKAVG